MEFRDYLVMGETKAGGRAELATHLKQQPNAITDAKAGRRGLPLAACWKLAELIGASKEEVTAASALNTEKDEEVRAYLRPFVEHARAAVLAVIVTIVSVSTFLTPTDANASVYKASNPNTLYYVKLNAGI